MATFYCSECNFSKPVKDEMAGKKARCPKCNAVNVVPELGEEPTVEPETETGPVGVKVETPESPETLEQPAAESTPDEAPAEAPAKESAPEASITKAKSSSATVSGIPRLSSGWLLAFGAALIPFVAGILLLSFKMVGIAMISFAAGMLAFAALAAYYSFT